MQIAAQNPLKHALNDDEKPSLDTDNMGKSTSPDTVLGDVSFMHAFITSLSVIVVSELGDKTFFIAAIMAMRHPRAIVFAGAISALALMTVLSGEPHVCALLAWLRLLNREPAVHPIELIAFRHESKSSCPPSRAALFGQLANLIPRIYTYYISTALFAIFGAKMLYDGYHMSPNDSQEEFDEVQSDLKKREDEVRAHYRLLGCIYNIASLAFV